VHTAADNPGVTFAHISDPHLSDLSEVAIGQLCNKRILGYLSWRRRRRQEHRREVLDALRADLATSGIQQLLITGDLTHIGLPEEFRQVREWLDALACDHISLVPGNHDSYVKARWQETYARWLPYMGGGDLQWASSLDDIYPTLDFRGHIAFIGLSSARPSLPFFASGELGLRQRDKLKTLLQETGGKGFFRVVCLHHPPIPGQEKRRKHLRDGRELLAVIEEAGAELVLHGHRHRTEIHFVSSAGREIPVLSVPSASALGEHGEVASYNRLQVKRDIGGWHLEVESRTFDSASHRFAPVRAGEIAIPEG
jgi:3',5'-cyclic AMP phosphodiesterase CpdA